MDRKKTAVLIGAGEFTGFEREYTEKDLILALDGGLLYCEENGIMPDYIIGDFDSLPEAKQVLLEKYPKDKILRLPRQKDDTDMLAAIRFGMKKGITDFTMYGGLGGRVSHTIANIQCLAFLKENGLTGRLLGDHCEIRLIQNETLVLEKRDSGFISLFAFGNRAEGVCIEGLLYELDNAALTYAFPIGVSNEFVGKEATIRVQNGTLLIIVEK